MKEAKTQNTYYKFNLYKIPGIDKSIESECIAVNYEYRVGWESIDS